MNWKKLLLIGLIALGFGFASTPSHAGVSVGIGIGVPVAYPYPPYPYPYYGYRPVVYAGPSFYWWHGRRVFITRHHRFHRVWWPFESHWARYLFRLLSRALPEKVSEDGAPAVRGAQDVQDDRHTRGHRHAVIAAATVPRSSRSKATV